MKIYTKTGDKGLTSLIGGTRVPKYDLRIESYGTVDELNSYVGLIRDQNITNSQKDVLKEIQDRLFTIGSELATDPDKPVKMPLPALMEADITLLENEIDEMDRQVKPLKAFLLPGGDMAISTAHIARCVCRRAERHCVNMAEKGLVIDGLVIKYLNRLSDYLFLVARYIAAVKGIQEIEWKPRINTRPR